MLNMHLSFSLNFKEQSRELLNAPFQSHSPQSYIFIYLRYETTAK